MSEQAAIERKARRQGWIPEAEWDDSEAAKNGTKRPAEFLSAEEFLEKVEGSVPMMRERMRRMDEGMGELKGKLEEQSGVIAELRDLLKGQTEMSKKAKKEAYERGLRDAETRMEQAVVDSDPNEFKKAKGEVAELSEKIKELDEQPKTKETKEEAKTGDVSDETKAWVRKNSKWFNDGRRPHLRGYMITVHTRLKAEHPDVAEEDLLDDAADEVREKFPEDFGENPARRGAPAVRPPSNGGGGRENNSIEARFSALPAADRAAYDRQKAQFAKMKPPVEFTKEQFLEAY
jgi:hypothetical protein